MEFNDESFENYIVEDAGVDKENMQNVQQVIICRQSNTKPQQIQKITESTQEISGNKLSKQDANLFWDSLTVELNEMGPPMHSSTEWRRVWTMYKSNKKRRHSGSDQEQSPQNFPFGGQSSNNVVEYAQILDKLNQILDKQNEVINRFVEQSPQALSPGVQGSNDGQYGQLDKILDKLNQILDVQNKFVGRCDAFDQILEKLNRILEVVSQFVGKMQSPQGLSSGVKGSDVGQYGPLDKTSDKLNQILDVQNKFVDRCIALDQILEKLNQILNK